MRPTAFPAPRLGQSRIEIDGRDMPARGTLGRFTAPFSFIGLPAISVPLPGENTDGLPLGVQIVGAPHRDGDVLRAAAALEATGITLS